MTDGGRRPGADLVRVVAAALEEVAPAASVVVAVSGGPDSTALLHLVVAARADLSVVVGHVRHGLRDDAADAAVAAGHASALALPYRERRVQVGATGAGPEAAARTARYRALAGLADETGARWVLVGHTADDQAETVVLNLLRGTGLGGLAGMPAARTIGAVTVLRPLLGLRRDAVRGFVAAAGLPTAADPTNADRSQPRAYVRHEVLPRLAGLPGTTRDPVASLTRLARLARDDAAALDQIAADHAGRLVLAWGPVRAVRRDALANLPAALASRVVRLMLAAVRGGLAGLPARAAADVLDLRPGEAVHVAGGVWVTAGGGWLAAARDGLADLREQALPTPGAVTLTEVGAILEAGPGTTVASDGELVPPAARHPIGGRGALPDGVALPLRVRARRPGDRILLPEGRRKLHDVFIDLGVPRALRGLVPVVVDARDEPAWVPGLAVRAGRTSPASVCLALHPGRPGAAQDSPGTHGGRS